MKLIVMGYFKKLEIKVSFYCNLLEVLDLEILLEKHCSKETCLMNLPTDLWEIGSVSVLSWLEQQTSSSNTDDILCL